MSIVSINTGKDIGIQAWGDSLTEATAGGNPFNKRWPTLLSAKFYPHVPVFNGGVGGESALQIATRQLGYLRINTQINVLWAGRNGVLTLTPQEIAATLDTMVQHVGDQRFIVISVIPYADGTEPAGSAARNKVLALNALYSAAYPNNYIDVVADLDSNSLRTDGLHLNAAANEIVATKVYNFIKAKGWIVGR